MSTYIAATLALLITLVSGCGESENTGGIIGAEKGISYATDKHAEQIEAAESTEIRRVLAEHLKAVTNEDLEGVKATFHPEMKDLEGELENVQWVFDNTSKLTYTLDTFEYIGGGVVAFAQTTRGKSAAFEDNRISGTWTLKRDSEDGDTWKLFAGQLREVVMLDKNGETHDVD